MVHFFTFKGNLLSRWLLGYRQFHVWNWFLQSIQNRLNFVWMLFLHECCASKERRSPAYIIVLVHMNWKLSFLAYHYGNTFECVCLRMIHKKTVKQFSRISIFAGYISNVCINELTPTLNILVMIKRISILRMIF